MNFVILDISLLVIFVIFIAIFLIRKRKNLKKEGLLLLYKTGRGIKLIEKVGEKYKKTLKVLGYISIGLGYFLMGGILYLFGRIVWIYISKPEVVSALKIPPIMPLVPYVPQIFKLTFLPPFYFIYWIIIIALIAIPHEFAHGIFAIRNKIRIKSTGFGFFPFFLPIFLAAFVEQDEESMNKSSKFSQMAVLSAGTFANVLTALLFLGIMFLFFISAFQPAGVMFDSYAYSAVAISGITSINGVALDNPSYENILEFADGAELIQVEAGEDSYIATKDFLGQQKENKDYLMLYNDAPAVKYGLESIITEIDGEQVSSMEKLSEELKKKIPGQSVEIKTITEEGEKSYKVILGESPETEGKAWLGIGFLNQESSGVMGSIVKFLSFKKPNIYYKPKFGASVFIYNLLWWIVLISFSVALINMLPVGIFDGGRFFYLTILAITKSEKKAKKTFAFMTYLFLFIVLVLMGFWVFSFIR